MTVVEKIIASIQAVHGSGFKVYYHDEPTLNLMTGGMEFPCAIMQLLTTGQVVTEAGQIKERVSAAVFFVEKADFDFDAKDNEQIIDRCKQRAFYWLSQLPRDQYITAELTRTSRVYDRYDDILTGFGLLIDITEIYGYSDCEELICPTDFNDDFNNDFGGRCFVPYY